MNTMLGAGDPDLNPEGVETVMQKEVPELFERCRTLIEERRQNPTDDLTSVLVHAELEGKGLEEHEIVMGFFLLMAAGNDSTKATYCSGMRALLENPDQKRKLIDDPSLIPSAVEEALRMFPAFAHFSRTTTRETELHGQKIAAGEKVAMWYVASNRDEDVYEDPDRFDVERNPEHQAFGAGGRHYCLGTALARMELQILIEETLKRYPDIELDGTAPVRRVAVRQPAQDAAGPPQGLIVEPARAHRHQQQPRAGGRDELVDRLARAVPVVVVVDDHDAAWRHAVVEMVELVLGRGVPVRVQAQQRDPLRCGGRDRLLDQARVVVDPLRGIVHARHPGLDVLEVGDRPDVRGPWTRAQQLRRGRAAVHDVGVGGRRHSLERVEQVQLARGLPARGQHACDRLHAAAAPDAALDDVALDPLIDDVAHGDDQREELLARGHRPGPHGADDGPGLLVVEARERHGPWASCAAGRPSRSGSRWRSPAAC